MSRWKKIRIFDKKKYTVGGSGQTRSKEKNYWPLPMILKRGFSGKIKKILNFFFLRNPL